MKELTKLEKLYNSIRGLKELGLPLNKETLLAVDEMEEELIKNEIIPRLSDNIEPIITKIERPIVLVVDYIPDEQLSVRLTRKRVITDEHETKKYDLISKPKDIKGTRKITSAPKRKKTKLAVTFKDGTRIQRQYAYETMLAAIEKIEAEKVAALDINWLGLPLVSKQKDDYYNQHELPGEWLVVTHSATNTKRQQLERISKKLNLGLKIEIIE